MVERKDIDNSTRTIQSSSEQGNFFSQKQQSNTMMDTRGIDIAKRIYVLFDKKDIDSLLEFFAEDVIVESFTGDEVPCGGIGRSRDYLRNQYFGVSLKKYDFKEINFDQFEYFVGTSGNQRTVHTHVVGKGYLKDEDKRPFILHSSHTYFFNDNWKITRYHEVCSMNYKQWE